jgi:hypothetical protein
MQLGSGDDFQFFHDFIGMQGGNGGKIPTGLSPDEADFVAIESSAETSEAYISTSYSQSQGGGWGISGPGPPWLHGNCRRFVSSPKLNPL